MDVTMPGRDGCETCRALEQSASTRLIPVVLVTSLNETRDKVRGSKLAPTTSSPGR